MKKTLALLSIALLPLASSAAVPGDNSSMPHASVPVDSGVRTRIGGFVGERIDVCMDGRVLT